MASLPSFESRALLRERMKGVLATLTQGRRLQARQEVFACLTPVLEGASCVLSFASLPDEIDLSLVNAWLLQRHALCLPRVKGNELLPYRIRNLQEDLVHGYAGILEPREDLLQVPMARIDAVIVPGLAFDADKQRLGRGGGYYDRFLQGLGPLTATYGVGFCEQFIDDTLSEEGHDVPLTSIFLV